jgi:hypothetical protein
LIGTASLPAIAQEAPRYFFRGGPAYATFDASRSATPAVDGRSHRSDRRLGVSETCHPFISRPKETTALILEAVHGIE